MAKAAIYRYRYGNRHPDKDLYLFVCRRAREHGGKFAEFGLWAWPKLLYIDIGMEIDIQIKIYIYLCAAERVNMAASLLSSVSGHGKAAIFRHINIGMEIDIHIKLICVRRSA